MDSEGRPLSAGDSRLDVISLSMVKVVPKVMELRSSPGDREEERPQAELQGSPAFIVRKRGESARFSRMPPPKRSRVSKWAPREVQNRPSSLGYCPLV